jgi:hypothetical protein
MDRSRTKYVLSIINLSGIRSVKQGRYLFLKKEKSFFLTEQNQGRFLILNIHLFSEKVENYLRYLYPSSAGEQQIFKNSLLCT